MLRRNADFIGVLGCGEKRQAAHNRLQELGREDDHYTSVPRWLWGRL